MKPINVIFDLDNTLVEVIYDQEKASKLLAEGLIANDSIVYACDYPHYIYPCCKSLSENVILVPIYVSLYLSLLL